MSNPPDAGVTFPIHRAKPKRRPNGCSKRVTPELMEEICEIIRRKGYTISVVLGMVNADVSVNDFQNAVKSNPKLNRMYVAAKAAVTGRLFDRVFQSEDTKDARWLLEKLNPSEFGSAPNVQVTNATTINTGTLEAARSYAAESARARRSGG